MPVGYTRSNGSNTGMFAVVAAGIGSNLILTDDFFTATWQTIAVFNNKDDCYDWAERNGIPSDTYYVTPATAEMIKEMLGV